MAEPKSKERSELSTFIIDNFNSQLDVMHAVDPEWAKQYLLSCNATFREGVFERLIEVDCFELAAFVKGINDDAVDLP